MIAAIIPAAGESRRMGRPKMALPWGDTSVLGRVVDVLQASGIDDIIVICGGARETVEALCQGRQVRTVFNQEYAGGEMLSSVQTGLKAMKAQVSAALIVLGDEPQIQESTVRLIVDEYTETESALIVPSYEMHRGHPWLVAKELWDEIGRLRAPASLREFLKQRAADIHYVDVNTATILQDLDTPGDYLKLRP
jgi:molybdenum cofactor cytidylyltransferase